MRELNFATEQSIAEAYEELQENFEMDIGAEVEWNTTEMLNGMLQVDAERQLGASWYERALKRAGYRCGSRPRRLVTTCLQKLRKEGSRGNHDWASRCGKAIRIHVLGIDDRLKRERRLDPVLVVLDGCVE